MNYFCDIGNTFISYISEETNYKVKKLLTQKNKNFLKKICKKENNVFISCVVREIENKYKFSPGAKFVTYKDIKEYLEIKYDTSNLGSDRIINIFAVKKLLGDNSIVVSCGTALTLDYLDSQGRYLGGEIFPGIGLALESLYHKTSRLPKVKLDKSKKLNSSLIGSETESCIIKGIYNFYFSGIKNFIDTISPVNVVFTGGWAKFFIGMFKRKNLFIVRNLTLLGLVLFAYSKNEITEKEYKNLISVPDLILRKENCK